MRDISRVAWLRFRTPGRPIAAAEILTRLGRAGAAREGLRRATVVDGRLRPGPPVGEAPLRPGTALCWSGRPGRRHRPPTHAPLRCLVARLPWPEGEVAGFRFRELAGEPGPLVELEVEAHGPQVAPVAVFLDWLAARGAPPLGDLRRGGILVEGGIRVRPLAQREPAGWWPSEPVFPPPGSPLRVSRATARALARGHPWVIADAEQGDRGAFPPGHLVQLEASAGSVPLGTALVDGDGRRTARRWSAPDVSEATIAERVHRALDRRETFHRDADRPDATDGYRLIHGEADGLPGLAVDRLGALLRIALGGGSGMGLVGTVARILWEGGGGRLPPGLPQLEVRLARRPEGARLLGVRWVPGRAPVGRDPEAPWWVREAGLRFALDLGLERPDRPRPGVGLFLDQRDNRRRLRALARGGRFVNLFAHTGAFSAALLAGGAREVWSVDLSAAYLAATQRNLEHSGLVGRGHHPVRSEARRFLERADAPQRLDGVVIDPPTAAAAGRRYWSTRRDLAPLVALAWSRLAPGGWLLVTRNEARPREPLAELVRAAVGGAAGGLAALAEAPPASDFPRLPGFPEGDAFEGVWLRRAAAISGAT